MNWLDAGVLGKGGMQTIEMARLLRSLAQQIQALLDCNSVLDFREDNCCISSVVNPNQLNGVGADFLLEQGSELWLLEGEEEAGLDDGEAASCKGWRTHHLDDIISGKWLFATADFDDEAETTWSAIGSFLAEYLYLGISKMSQNLWNL
jgi:hypothetical protein